MPSELVVGRIEFHQPRLHSAAVYAEQRRLKNENEALRSLLREWYELFAPVRREGTEGARLLDRTAEAMTSEFRYKTPNRPTQS